ncbi:MAG: hypothetical protein IKR89_08745 [Bacteroidaceae bacterium]|nr:hypothetical protein [Bacteroidaceae bacterium]
MKIKQLLQGLSFKTGVIILALCIPFYIISFAQMALSISTEMKGVLWFVFFGLAKTFQYGGLTILGVDGWKKLKAYFGNNKETE